MPLTPVDPGDLIGSLEVHAAPGHTPGQIALLDTRDRTLIAADAFSTLGGVRSSGRIRPGVFPFPAISSWNRRTARETAAKLADLAPARLATGHGPVVDLANVMRTA